MIIYTSRDLDSRGVGMEWDPVLVTESWERQTSWKVFPKLLWKVEGLCKRVDAIDFVLLEVVWIGEHRRPIPVEAMRVSHSTKKRCVCKMSAIKNWTRSFSHSASASSSIRIFRRNYRSSNTLLEYKLSESRWKRPTKYTPIWYHRCENRLDFRPLGTVIDSLVHVRANRPPSDPAAGR